MTTEELKKVVEKESKLLDDAEVTRFQEMIARIGRHETKGAIYMVETIEADKDGFVAADGLLFTNGLSKHNVIINVIRALFPNKVHRRLLLDMLPSLFEIVDEEDKG